VTRGSFSFDYHTVERHHDASKIFEDSSSKIKGLVLAKNWENPNPNSPRTIILFVGMG